MPKLKSDEGSIYVGISKEADAFLRKYSEQSGETLQSILDELISSARARYKVSDKKVSKKDVVVARVVSKVNKTWIENFCSKANLHQNDLIEMIIREAMATKLA